MALSAALLLGGAALLFWAIRQPVGSLVLFVLLLAAFAVGAAAGLGLATIGFFRLGYQFAPGRLLIHWAGPSDTILLDEIDGIFSGQRIGLLGKVRGLTWPGYYVGTVRSRTLGTLRVYCTERRTEALSVIVTAARTIVLSPSDPTSFRRELIRRIEENASNGSSFAPEASSERAALPSPISIGLFAASSVLLLGGLMAISANYSMLPETLSLTAWVTGTAAPGPKSQLFELPSLGMVMLAVNAVLAMFLRRRERAAPFMLLGSAVLFEAVLLVAALRLLA